ncbi:MAG TPA: hypothetical protein VLV85_02940 [Stellaceae bacterium]|jgi:hypothetical protein|nr:hypothetical protein [Stellaceae bacterium]
MSKGKTAKSSNADVTPRRAGRDEATPPEALRRRGIDALLDAALEATFPASDPIAIEVDR